MRHRRLAFINPPSPCDHRHVISIVSHFPIAITAKPRQKGISRLPGLSLTLLVLSFSALGCGTTQKRDATDQLVLSNALDESIASIDFRALSGENVYLDTTYIRQINGLGFVNADYVISSLRQQVVAAGCHLHESISDSDIVIEARCGALGADGHQTTYGLPAGNPVAAAAQAMPGTPALPLLPEISFARRDSAEGAAKVAAFAYDRETRQVIWQSGISKASVNAKDTWVLGVGPFRGGSIRDRTTFAGDDLPLVKREEEQETEDFQISDKRRVDYSAETYFQDGLARLRQRRADAMRSGAENESIGAESLEDAPRVADNLGGATSANTDIGDQSMSNAPSITQQGGAVERNNEAQAVGTNAAEADGDDSGQPQLRPPIFRPTPLPKPN